MKMFKNTCFFQVYSNKLDFFMCFTSKKKSNVQKPKEFIGLFRQVNELPCVFKHFDNQNFKNQWFFKEKSNKLMNSLGFSWFFNEK